jgi:predicted  nucleic acid-binding Zn-ribbon protein
MRMNDFKTPVSRLARLFRDARDRWKAKALERQKRLRAAQVRIRDLEHSRAYWKERALAAEEAAARADAAGGGSGERRRDEPPMALMPTPIANHHHSLEAIELSLQLYLHAGLGCRGVG